jgi:hypothetical protein
VQGFGTNGARGTRTPGRVETRRKLLSPMDARGPLRAHTLAVNDVGIAFLKAARPRAEDECGPLAWRHEVAHPISLSRETPKSNGFR